MQRSHQGSLLAIAAFSVWGAFPFYFKLVTHIHPLEVLANRAIWAVISLLALLGLIKQWSTLAEVLKQKKHLLWLVASTILIAINWATYIWSVTSNQLYQASLGYYINPLVIILLGFIFFQERLRPIQWLAVLLAAIGVLIQIISVGQVPWIALTLAFSFGFYGLIHKHISVDGVPGLLIETVLLLPIALLYLSWLVWQQQGPVLWTTGDLWLLAAAGPVTVTPLLLFTAATKRITYMSIGFFQYITPSVLFLLASFVYQEPFSVTILITFIFIWSALIIISLYALWQYRYQQKIIRTG